MCPVAGRPPAVGFYPDERYTPPAGTVGGSGRGLPSFDLVVPSRTQPGPAGPGSPHDRTVARPRPPGRATFRSGRPSGHQTRQAVPRRAGAHPFVPALRRVRPLPPARLSRMLLLVVPLVLFALITWQVLADGPLLGLDERLSDALVHPDRPSELLSDLGNVTVAVPVLALALAMTAWRLRATGVDRWWLPPAAGAAAMVLVPVLVVPLKAWTDRPGTPAVPRRPATSPRATRPRRWSRTARRPCCSSSSGHRPYAGCWSRCAPCWSWAPRTGWCAAATTGRWTWRGAGASARCC